jgi:hypothetical protein
MDFDELVARNLAAALLATDWTAAALDKALINFLGEAKRRRGKLAQRLVETFETPPDPAPLRTFLLETNLFQGTKRIALKIILKPPKFVAASRFAALDIPKLATTGELAEWLGVTPARLDWLADARRMQSTANEEALRHYRYRFVARKSGPPRLLEAPKQHLKSIQRRILHDILDPVPTHDAAYGFVAGRSCSRAAARHAGERIVICFDLRDFFLTTPMNRVYALFRALGYPYAVADRLTRLCGATTPHHVFEALSPDARYDFETRRRFEALHLPQGAPTSPALANLVAFRLDTRLAGLARRYGAAYTRYADDLSFSGDEDFAARAPTFAAALRAIARDEGFSLNETKTRAMRAHQRQLVTGVVVNAHVNLRRDEYDRLKAMLFNCARNGPAAENRAAHPQFRAHLDGRVAWVEQLDRARGEKLRALYERIDWGN